MVFPGKLPSRFLATFFLLTLISSACNFTDFNDDQDSVPTSATQQLVSTPRSPNQPTNSTRECRQIVPQKITPEDAFVTIIEAFELKVSSGNIIYGLLRRPDPALYADKCFPAVIFVPGGINPGRMEAYGQDAKVLSETGMVVVTFNAEGRVGDSPDDIRSTGSEDYNGHRHQDSLCDLVRYTLQLPYVISNNVGIKSQSYGITMAAGCVGRYPTIPVKYLVDGEGPPNSFVTCHEARALILGTSDDKFTAVHEIFGRYSAYRDPSPENLAFWAEREAERFIGAFRGRYLRLQAEWDHAQPPGDSDEITTYYLPPDWWQNKHTMDIVNIAIEDDVPWVRVNLPEQGNQVNMSYDFTHPPVYLPGMLAEKPWAVRAILEMARME